MSKKCAKCDKTVYPTEELKCLDKVWHKGCFRCWECGMALNMKNYKGYDRRPYCSAHYPQTKATVVVDTPEQQRLARQSQIQSQALYHADFEKNIKGTVTVVADDPETKRAKEVANVISQAAYTRGRSNSESIESERRPSEAYTRQSRGSVAEVQDSRPAYIPPQNPHIPSARMITVPANVTVQSALTNKQVLNPSASPSRDAKTIQAPRPHPASAGQSYQAMYDYDAQDDDEVSFLENDRITLCEMIDEGWMYGIVERTGHKGMIPANYVELIQ